MFCCTDVSKTYKTPHGSVHALSHVSLCCQAGTLTSIVGPSGCGKSSLLAILGGLDGGFTGSFELDGVRVAADGPCTLDEFRRRDVGFVFQDFNLIEHLTALENVETALALQGEGTAERRTRAQQALVSMGVADLADRLPDELSGGQAQRVALARAVAGRPRIVLADEPTGSLDPVAAAEVARVLRGLADSGHTVIVVTHNRELFEQIADQVVVLAEGRVAQVQQLNRHDTRQASAATKMTEGSASATFANPHADAPAKRSAARLGFLVRSHLRVKAKRSALVLAVLAVGVLGLGLVFSVASGAGAYLAHMEEGLLTDYPLSVEEDPSVTMAVVQAAQNASAQQADGAVSTMLSTVFDEVQETSGMQDLLPIRSYVQRNQAQFDPLTYGIQYDYPLDISFYAAAGTADLHKVSMDELLKDAGLEKMVDHGAVMSMASQFPAVETVFKQLVGTTDAQEELYDVLDGRLPRAAHEVVVVTNAQGQVSDYLLCLLGVVDPAELAAGIIEQGEAAENEMVGHLQDNQQLYGDLMGLQLKAALPCDSYEQQGNRWKRLDGQAALDGIADHAFNLTVVGIVRPKSSSGLFYDPGAIAYTGGLHDALRAHAADTPVVAAQMADPQTNVLTGRTFNASHTAVQKYLGSGSLDWLDESKRAYVATLSNKRTEALVRWVEGSFGSIEAALADEDARATISAMSQEEFESNLESVAPASMDDGYAQALAALGYIPADDFTAIDFFPRSFPDKDRIVHLLEQAETELGVPVVCTDAAAAVMDLFDSQIKTVACVLVVLSVIALAVMALVLSFSMRVTVIERTREIGCLRALGASRRDVVNLFLREGLLLAGVAVVVGLLVCVAVAPALDAAVTMYTGIAHLVAPSPLVALAVAAVVIVVAALSTLAPVRAATKADPVRALHAV